MNVLEKILEEIKARKEEWDKGVPTEYEKNVCQGIEIAEEIIGEHLVKKKKVTSAEVISETFDGKQYYEIKYREVDKNDYTIGYGSYILDYVLEWLNECFEFCEEVEVTSHLNDGWIPVTERLPEDIEYALVTVSGEYEWTKFENAVMIGDYDFRSKDWVIEGWEEWRNPNVVAWMPLPEAYKEGNNGRTES